MLFQKLPELRALMVKVIARLIEIHFDFAVSIMSSALPKECLKTLLADLPEIAKEAGIVATRNIKTRQEKAKEPKK